VCLNVFFVSLWPCYVLNNWIAGILCCNDWYFRRLLLPFCWKCTYAWFLPGVLAVCNNRASFCHLLAADRTHCCNGNLRSERLSSYGVLPLSHGIISTKFPYTVKKTVDVVILRLFSFELFHNMFILLPIKTRRMNKRWAEIEIHLTKNKRQRRMSLWSVLLSPGADWIACADMSVLCFIWLHCDRKRAMSQKRNIFKKAISQTRFEIWKECNLRNRAMRS
jgi:hypothetical protein